MVRPILLMALILLGFAPLLAGCGKKGLPKPPAQVAAEQAKKAEAREQE